LQSQRRLAGASFHSFPSRWSTTRERTEPHSAHCRGPGGMQCCALYLWARSLMALLGLRQSRPQAGAIPPRRRLHLLQEPQGQ
jgi:hypothetical protein